MTRRCLWKVADAFLDLEWLSENIKSRNGRCARGRRKEAGQHPHGCCFARSVRSEKADDLAFFDLERNVVDGGIPRVSLCKCLYADHKICLLVSTMLGLDFASHSRN